MKSESIKDFLGNELQVGDEVVFTNNCEEFDIAIVTEISFKGLFIQKDYADYPETVESTQVIKVILQ